MQSNDILFKSSSDCDRHGVREPHTTKPDNPSPQALAATSVIVLTFQMLGNLQEADMYHLIRQSNTARFLSVFWDLRSIVHPLDFQ